MSELAARLAGLGPSDSVVAILLPNSADFVIALLACLTARRPCLPLDLNFPAERNQSILATARPVTVITSQHIDVAALLPARSPHRINIGTVYPVPIAPYDLSHAAAGSNDDAAMILFTSGSTGQPKGIVNSTAALLQRVLQYVNAGRLDREDQFLTLSSPCTIAGLRETLTPLLIGATLHIAAVQGWNLRDVQARIRNSKITIYNSVPAIIRSLVGLDGTKESFTTLRLIRLGGEALFWSDAHKLRQVIPAGCAIQIGYSSTESTGTQWFVPPRDQTDEPFVPIGYLLPGNDAAIVGENGHSVVPGEIGELWIRSRFAALGHWIDGRLCEDTFPRDFAEATRRIIKTGDLVRLRTDNVIEPVGRADRQVKINGQRAEPAEVEAALRWSPNLADTVVISRHSGTSAYFVAFVTPASADAGNLAAELKLLLTAKLPSFMHPGRLHIVDALPRLPSGKPDVPALSQLDELLQAREAKTHTLTPSTASEALLTAIETGWQSVLPAPLAGRDISFRDAGGDSLGLLQVIFYLEKGLGRPLSLDLLNQEMTISDMANSLATDTIPTPSCRDGRPVVLLLPGLNGDEPRLARFRASLKNNMEFVILSYPDWPEMIAGNMDFHDFAHTVYSQITTQAPEGPLLLAGYSFGGAVAARVTEYLEAAGRDVHFLGILDTDLSLPPATTGNAIRTLALRLVDRFSQRTTVDIVAEFLGSILARPSVVGTVRRLLPLFPKSKGRFGFVFHNQMLGLLRSRIWYAWQTSTINAKLKTCTVLFRSTEHSAYAEPDLGWGRRCQSLRVIDVTGDHFSMFNQDNVAVLTMAFAQALAPTLMAGSKAHPPNPDDQGKFLCEPSQRSPLPAALQPRRLTTPDSVGSNFIG